MHKRPGIAISILLLLVFLVAAALLAAVGASRWFRLQYPSPPPEGARLVSLLPPFGQAHIRIALRHASPGVLLVAPAGSPPR